MTTMAEVERRIEVAQAMRAIGRTYDEIAAALGIHSRSLVHYYLNRAERQEKSRENWRKTIMARDGQPLPRSVNCGLGYDPTRFKPENHKQAAMWRQLLAGATL
jgi:hypothetical protein